MRVCTRPLIGQRTLQIISETAAKIPPIVSQQEWEAVRREMLVKEKSLMRAQNALAADRPRMPSMAIEKTYEVRRVQWQGWPAGPA